jgi:CobQ-like glutamine amidotransferase family enzyme
MKIEFLYPELVTLYGENGNREFLQKNLPDAEFVSTSLDRAPAFITGTVDLVYIGSMIDNYFGLAIEALRPYKDALKAYIDSGKVFLATGNAMDLFGKYIQFKDKRVEGLGLFDYYSVEDTSFRHNSWFLGKFEGIKITAFRSTFTRQFGSDADPFIKVLGGSGRNDKSKVEGARLNNFYATSLLGPFLIINPPFAHYLLGLLGADKPLCFEETAVKAYQHRLAWMEEPDARFVMGALG